VLERRKPTKMLRLPPFGQLRGTRGFGRKEQRAARDHPFVGIGGVAFDRLAFLIIPAGDLGLVFDAQRFT
jgi:hypothetical protein